MGTVARQEKIGDSSITLSFENYQDFLDYQQKEKQSLDSDFRDVAGVIIESLKSQQSQEQAYWHLQLTKEEFYYPSCILGHLVPAGKISKSLLDKVSLDELDCEDFDLIQFVGDTFGGYSIKLNEEKE